MHPTPRVLERGGSVAADQSRPAPRSRPPSCRERVARGQESATLALLSTRRRSKRPRLHRPRLADRLGCLGIDGQTVVHVHVLGTQLDAGAARLLDQQGREVLVSVAAPDRALDQMMGGCRDREWYLEGTRRRQTQIEILA